MRHNIKYVLGLLTLGILMACTQDPELTLNQIAEKALNSSTVRLFKKVSMVRFLDRVVVFL